FAVLSEVAASGLAVLVVGHSTKAAAETEGIDARGSGAFVDMAEVVVTMARVKDGGQRQRALNAESRWHGTPPLLVVELLPDGLPCTLIAGGERDQAREQARASAVRDEIANVLPLGPPGLTTKEMSKALGITRQAVDKKLKAASSLDLVGRDD